jgi:deoxyribose-phosphate aldolase
MIHEAAAPRIHGNTGRNPGVGLELDWLRRVQVNRSAVERRVATLVTRRTVKQQWQSAWLVKAVTLIDLTTLAGDDTPGRVRRLCAKARQPLRGELVEALGLADRPLTVAAVCVYHQLVEPAVAALEGSGVPVAAVAAGFPAGLSPFDLRRLEVARSVAAGAREIDIVITRGHVLAGDWHALHDEVASFRDACGGAHLKAILATGELGTLQNIYKAALVCMMAGADFVKTSTGKEVVNATLPVGLTMARAVREFQQRTGFRVGFKAAGGISTAKDALAWLILVREELGPEWLRPELFRFGASSLLGDIERQLEHQVTGRYAAAYRNPLA